MKSLGEKYNIPEQVALAHNDNLLKHLENVYYYCRLLDVPESQYMAHDKSKFSKKEFPYYAMQFFGKKFGYEPNPNMFNYAWLHHIHHNPHHWQYWIFPDAFQTRGSDNVENGILEMPENYVMEMLADWQAASIAYAGKEDMTEWLTNNLSHIMLHSESKKHLAYHLKNWGYGNLTHLLTTSE